MIIQISILLLLDFICLGQMEEIQKQFSRRLLAPCTSAQYQYSSACHACDTSCNTCTNNAVDGLPCIICKIATNIVSATTKKCVDCSTGFVGTDSLCYATIANCNTQTAPPLACSDCATNYYIDASSTCTACVSPCLACSTSTVCTSCISDSYYLDASSACQSCISPCSKCSISDGTACTSCVSGYYFNAGTCTSCQPDCLTCTYTTAIKCQTCSIGKYVDTSFVCQSCTSPCLGCTWDSGSSSVHCTSCITPAYYVDGTNNCVPCISPCVQCLVTDGTKCTVCIDTFYADSSNVCQSCVSPCVNCSGTTGSYCSTCVDNYYPDSGLCKTCDSPCKKCMNSTVCLSCLDTFFFDGITSCIACTSPCVNCSTSSICLSCDNAGGYYLSTTTCLKCSSFCGTCPDGGTGSVCTTCSSDRQFDANNNCVCKDGKYDDGTNTCFDCPTQCGTCALGAGSQPYCLSCADGYYSGTNNSCYKCSSPCGKCTSLVDCIDCDTTTGRTMQSGVCKCGPGFFSDEYDSIQCLTCNPKSCDKCSQADPTAEIICSSCQTGTNRTFNPTTKQCPCDAGYFEDPTGGIPCVSCPTTCSICLASGNTYECTSCVAGNHRIVKTGQCLCDFDNGFYDNGVDLCATCTSPCKTCHTTATTCDSCVDVLKKVVANACVCIDGYYSYLSTVCNKCADKCATCQSTVNGDICNTCSKGYYIDPNNANNCIICVAPCYECTGADSGTFCDSCLATANMNATSGKCSCKPNYYINSTNGPTSCLQCVSPCYNCEDGVDGTVCKDCPPSSNRLFNSTSKTCPCLSNYYYITGQTNCIQCVSPCLTCSNDGTGVECLSCVTGAGLHWVLTGNQCLCDTGYFLSSGACNACISPCLTCVTTGSTCQSCVLNLFRQLVGSVCSCIPGYYDNGQLLCAKCDYTCKECSGSATSCTLCDALSFRTTLTSNACPCDNTYYDNQTSSMLCQSCTPPCFYCASNTNGTKCTQCVAGSQRAVVSNQCVCNTGFYDNNDNGVCPPCYFTCKTCSNNYSCLTCDGALNLVSVAFEKGNICVCATGYYMDSTTQTCQKACPEDCQTCDASGNCLTCLSTRTLTNGRCVCTLNSGGYYCRTSCSQTHITKVMSLLRGTSNDLGTSITGLGFSLGSQLTDSVNFNSYTSLVSTLRLGYIIKNGNRALFQNKRQLDYQIFGQYNYYDRFIKDNILYMVFQRDSIALSFDIYYDYSSSLTYQTLYLQTNTLAFSNWNNYHQLINIDSFEVLLIISIQDTETVTINYDQQPTYLKMTINIGNTNSFIKPAIITQIVLNQNTAVTNTQFDNIGQAISQLFDQAASYECHPHPKAIRQVIRENHQTIINLLPATLVAMQSDDGQNYITQAKSSSMFTASGGVAITLNAANLNYFNSQYQQSNGNYQYSSVSFPDSLFFSISFTNSFALTSFKIQHNVASGYSIQQTTLTYVTSIGTFTGLLVDLYGTTSVKTLIFSQSSTINFVVTQNTNNIIITATGAKPALYFYVFGTNDQLQLGSSYNQPLFNQLVNLVLNSIQYCSSNFTPLRYVKEYLKLNLANILPTVISITEPATSYLFQTGTAVMNGQTAFTNSHIISTDLDSNVLFSNGFIKDGSLQFGTSSKYFTYLNKIFILGATLNGINYINLKLDNNLGGTPTCTNSQLLTSDGGQILTAYISDCRWTQHQIVNFYIVDLTTGLSLTQIPSTTSVNIKLSGLINNQFIYLATLVQSVSNLITTQLLQQFLTNLGQQMFLSRQFIPCNIQCLTKDSNYNCKTYRSGYQSNQFIELAAPLQSDINNIGGKKCQYFSFNDAKTMIQSNKNTFDTYLKTKSTGLINSAVNNTYITIDRYSVGQITSNLKSTPPLASPQIGQTDITLITATYLGAQSQLYSYQLNSLYYVLMETNVDTVYINNVLNIDSRGFLIFLQNTFNDYGLAYTSQCSIFYNNTIYSNVQECIIRQLIPYYESLTNTVTAPTKAVQYVITQTNNPVLIYTVISSFGFPITNSNMNDIAYKIYSDFINQNQESNCICWGRYRIQGQNCRCQSGYYPPSIPYTQYGIQDCLPCNFRCKTCQFQDTQCLSCPLSSFRVLDTTAFTCACQSGYMEISNTVLCVACFYQCGECSGTINTCTSCGVNSFRALSGSLCNCNSGYYDDGSSKACQQCHFSCTTCNAGGSSACQTCSGTRYKSGTTCLCNPGTYENNVAVCPACDYTCATCVTSASNCQTCSGGITRTQSANTCPCSAKYYNILNQANCAACNTYCGSCTGSAVNQCIDCPNLSNRSLVSGGCVCSSGFYQDALNSVVCPACDYSCLTCQTTSTNCKTCDAAKKRTLTNSQCICNDGFYDNGSAMCQPCDVSCLTCQGNATSCTKCPLNANRSYDSINKKCPCLPTFSDAGIVNCLKCANSCQGCFGTASNCTACNIVGTNRLDNSGTTNSCPCQNGYFDDGINMLCQSCSPSCQKCSSLNYCTACNVAMQRIDQSASGKCPCQNGFFDNTINSMCQTCDYSCLTCVTTAKNCTSCNVGVNRVSGSTCPCDVGYFDNGLAACAPCNLACQTCSGAANQCTSCPPTRSGNSCLCSLGYIDVGAKQCQQCNYKCGTCTAGSLNVCLSCNVNRVLAPTCDCAEGFIEFNQVCTTCPNQCGTCDDNKNCLSCKGDRINLPSCVCPQGYYEDGISSSCTLCFSYCSQCNKTTCQACLGNRVIKNNACVCPTGSIQNPNTYLCSNCQNAVIQAAFSSDLSQIIISFPYTIQYPQTKIVTSAQACTMLFTNATSNLLGQQPLCVLQGTTIIITLGLQSTIITNSTLVFNNGIVQQQGCTTTISQFLITSFTYPTTIPNPFFSLPQFQDPITLCQDITLNMLNIRNSGNRVFPIVQWTLVSMIPYDATVASYLQNLMTSSNNNMEQSLTIAKLQLSEYGSYTVQLKAFNFLNKSYSSQTTFQTQSKEAPIVEMDPNQQFVFGLWQDMAFTISFSHLSCTTGEVIQVYDALRINWTQILANKTRLLQDTTDTTDTTNTVLLPTSKISETDGMTFLNTLTIPQYTATIGQDYTFVVSVSLTNKPIQQSLYFTASVVSTPMQAYIDGGTRTQSIGAIAQINGFCRDPDQNFPWNTEPGITFSWQCINLVTGKACLDSVDQPLKLNTTATNQSFMPRVLAPYQPLQFIMVNTKNAITLTTSVVILVIEMDLPVIGANYPSGYDSRKILLHEQLNFTITTTEDPDSLKYFCQILYNYNVVAVFRFKFLQVQFRIWDYFSDVTQDVTQIQIKLAAQDLYHYLPSTITMNFDINVPPTGCTFSISPLTGTSIVDIFSLSVTGCQDTDLPLTYQFHIYGGLDIMEDDIIKGESIRKTTLQDPSQSPSMQTVLPSPSKLDGSQGDTLVIIASIYDSNYGMTNITKTIKLKSIVTKILSGVDFQSIIQQINRSLKLSTITTPQVTNLPSLFIASVELSTIYNILSGSPNKQAMMKPTLQNVYKYVNYFQGKLTSKFLQETLLSSLSSVGGTGVTFQAANSSDIDIYSVRQQILQVQKQLATQITNLQYLLQQKAQSGGSSSQFEIQIKTIDNVILNQGLVTDSLFNAIKGTSFKNTSDADINLLKTQVQTLNGQISSTSLTRTLPNAKPIEYTGKEMSMTASKATPANIVNLLSTGNAPTLYSENDESTQATDLNGTVGVNSKQIDEDEIDFAKYLLEHPDLNSIYGVPNKSSTRMLQETYDRVVDGVRKFKDYLFNRNNLTYVRMLEQTDPSQVKQYSVQMSNYQTSPYMQDPSFKSSLVPNATTTVKDGQNITVDNSIVSQYGTVTPSINVSQNGQNQQLSSLNGQQISLQFTTPKNASAGTLQCSQQGSQQWQTGTCKIRKTVNAAGQIIYACDCEVINPTTVLTTLNGLISNKLNSVFGADALSTFANIQFWKYAIFYIALIFTGVFITLMVIGQKKDNEDFMQEISKELEPIAQDMPELQELKREFNGLLLKTIKEDEEDKEFSIHSATDLKNKVHDIKDNNDIQQLALGSLQQNHLMVRQENGRLQVLKQNVKSDRLEEQIKYNQQRLDMNQVKRQLNQHDFLSEQKNRVQGRAANLREVVKNVYSISDLAYENGQNIKLKPFSIKLLCEGVMTLHRVLNILMLYDDIISRPARFALIYSKTILVLALSALFSGNFGPVYSILMNIFVGQVINIILQIITVLMKASPILKLSGIIFTAVISGVCWFIVLMLSAQMDQTAADAWAVQFLSAQVSDLVVIESLVCGAKLALYPWIIKALHNPDNTGNSIAHLAFIAVAQPQIQKFYVVE